jgi:hypothetical protein
MGRKKKPRRNGFDMEDLVALREQLRDYPELQAILTPGADGFDAAVDDTPTRATNFGMAVLEQAFSYCFHTAFSNIFLDSDDV